MSDKAKSLSKRASPDSLATRQDQDLQLQENAVGIQASELETRIESLFQRRRKLVQSLRTEHDPDLRDILKQRIAQLREAEGHASDLLKDLKALEPLLRHQYELLRNGRHPQEALFRVVAEHEKIKDSDMFQSRATFLRVFIRLLYDYRFLEEELRERDKAYRTDFTLFRRKSHPQQTEIEELAAQRGFSLHLQSGEDAYRMFISLAKDHRILQQIQQGLDKESLEALLEQAQQSAEEAQEEAEHQLHLVTVLQEELTASDSRRKKAESQLAREKRKRSAEEKKVQRLDQEAKKVRAHLQGVEDELESLRSDHVVEKQRLDSLRDEIRQRAEAIRASESKQARTTTRGLYLDRELGFLLLESRRTLQHQVQSKERPNASDPFLFLVVNELLGDERFEERYLHAAGREIVKGLNLYFCGEQPLSSVLATLRSLDFSQRALSPTPILPETGDRELDLLETWLQSHRAFQREQFERYRLQQHPMQQMIGDLFLREGVTLVDRKAWILTWDRHPKVFVSHLDNPKRKEHK